MIRYRSDYSNQVHQLVVSVSKHYYLTKDDRLVYQHRPIEIDLKKLENSKKRNMIIFSIRDHYSGVFYCEIKFSPEKLSLIDFLFRAWSKKELYSFCGIPESLVVSKTVGLFFPEIRNKLDQLNVNYIEATSGFQNGVRDIRTIEEYMKGYAFFDNRTIDEQTKWICEIFAKEKSRNMTESKIELWERGKKTIYVPSNKWREL